MAMVQMLEGRWDISWSVTLEIHSINWLRRSISSRVQHSFREGNTLVDYFANLVFDFAAGESAKAQLRSDGFAEVGRRLAGWANGPNEAGLKSLVPKWAEKIEPNPILFKGWVEPA
ncbi:hypothetical protein H5410_031521 [Solanum commersonii]|uniref:RNase H type-1 domain-containing protein n=1 Tax=Solanum commersonii TaxID=4109 RepID=A0A9J5YK62_SOLCO|nr:hypothetical protein H5410_031521 [Solanum commersonii]